MSRKFYRSAAFARISNPSFTLTVMGSNTIQWLRLMETPLPEKCEAVFNKNDTFMTHGLATLAPF
jgi:hypothetical protein